MAGGDINKAAIQEAFSRIKEDILKLSQEIYELKARQKSLIEENILLKSQLDSSEKHQSLIIEETVKQTLKSLGITLAQGSPENKFSEIDNSSLPKAFSGQNINPHKINPEKNNAAHKINPNYYKYDKLIKRINKRRKSIIISRIITLANEKMHSLPEIKDIIVDSESLCSKATFYRYINKLKASGIIDIIKIGERDILASLKT